MEEKVNAPVVRKKAIESVKVKIALGLCLVAIIAMLLPCVHFTDEAVLQYRDVDHNNYNIFDMARMVDVYIILGAVQFVGFLLAAVFFFTDHPKLSLLGSILGLFASFAITVSAAESSGSGSSVTLWAVITILCALALIVFAFIIRKANPRRAKGKG